ncbi:MAG TPA: hypothetical protein PLY56_00925 [Armatimonadota bacterium]|nr:hypothetical protein [Armatimonadota bacterium]
MVRILFLPILLVSVSIANAAVKPGENILINGSFDSEDQDGLAFWEKSGVNVSSSRTGGPGKSGVLVFSNPEGKTGVRSTCRQHGQRLAHWVNTFLKARWSTRPLEAGRNARLPKEWMMMGRWGTARTERPGSRGTER